MVVNYSYLGRLVRESIERELNMTHLLRAVGYSEFTYNEGVASRLLSSSLRIKTKGFIRKCEVTVSNYGASLDLKKEYIVALSLQCTLANKSMIHLTAYVRWDFSFNRTLRFVTVCRGSKSMWDNVLC